MALRFIGIDPDTGQQGSPTVWVDEEKGELVLQGWEPDEKLEAECARTSRRSTGLRSVRDSVGARYPTREVLGLT
ncbi:hypothetical protein [Streptomyces zhihengii]|uniref:hypothetical protein n=1 Tax=Streptomyces zhihengii TaxID=1818004 RepID=UPI003F4BD7A4